MASADNTIRDPATGADEVCRRHSDILREWAGQDDRLGAIARATLRAGGEIDE